MPIMLCTSGYECLFNRVVTHTTDYLKAHKPEALIVGVSGGLDSAITTVLAWAVCKKLGLPLLGYTLIIDEDDEVIRQATQVGARFCTKYTQVNNFKATYDHLVKTISPVLNDERRRQALQLRSRMLYLYDQSYLNKGLVLSTYNYTEHLLNLWEAHQEKGHIGIIESLLKTEIYGLLKHFVEYYETINPEKAETLKYYLTATPDIEDYEEVDKQMLNVINGMCQFEGSSILTNRYKRDNMQALLPHKLNRALLMVGSSQSCF